MKLLLVCLGNICRSPMAEGALRHHLQRSPLAGRVQVDSAGTGDWHSGEAPDRRAIACARGHGVDIAGLRARQLQAADFADFDWILCADASNLRNVRQRAPAAALQRVALWLPWAGLDGRREIPDPYTGGSDHFEDVWRLVDDAAAGSVARLSADGGSGIIGR
ncbi:low molecular weight protein-tyrosine-phosphatase [Xanthomonas cerealis]|uniref:protein-tyrosine-phosphatase n=2 Tax=Xanthomonas translucens group TaxID=3390202 RepID=A0A514ED07_9XANT|nr:low molecular weight protein-tyrosine-phosphatase [Xanthomonas translucens]QDI03904.1 low molecular weight phosphotyrosine protein phosphatase [Xanthomonas translucens pv. cerealis]UKE45881.1 low molecular weight phosphotyrosine protein phosphatase [Xanthomonas translucens pv. cerealis]UKE68227.1 low molecular weight phosphotyrosine protein phosphatase [Xanthomonas translucens pv. pistacia]